MTLNIKYSPYVHVQYTFEISHLVLTVSHLFPSVSGDSARESAAASK